MKNQTGVLTSIIGGVAEIYFETGGIPATHTVLQTVKGNQLFEVVEKISSHKVKAIALSDINRFIASPLKLDKRDKFMPLLEEIKKIIRDNQVEGIVIGLPINMNGTEGPRCEAARQFAKNIEAHLEYPIVFWDERLSTVAVTRTMIEADLSRKRQKEVVDKMAASYMLQGALDAMATSNQH